MNSTVSNSSVAGLRLNVDPVWSYAAVTFEAILKLEKREIDEITPETVKSGDTVALLNFQRDLVLYAVKNRA